MDPDKITPMILTANCEANIGSCLEDLRFAKRIVVVDSGSTDATLDICRRYKSVEVFFRKFDHHASQRMYGISLVETEWVLCLDSDYRLTPDFVLELARRDARGIDGFTVRYRYCVHGHVLRASLLPDRVILARTELLKVRSDGHAERFEVAGTVARLNQPMLHDDRKPFDRRAVRQMFYSRLDALKWSSGDCARWQDRVKRMGLIYPVAVVSYLIVVRGLWLDGKYGWHYVMERLLAAVMTMAFYSERRLGGKIENDKAQ